MKDGYFIIGIPLALYLTWFASFFWRGPWDGK